MRTVPQEPRAGPAGMSKAEASLLVQKAFGVSGKLSAGLSLVYSFIEHPSCGDSVEGIYLGVRQATILLPKSSLGSSGLGRPPSLHPRGLQALNQRLRVWRRTEGLEERRVSSAPCLWATWPLGAFVSSSSKREAGLDGPEACPASLGRQPPLWRSHTHGHSGLNITHPVSLIPATPQGEQAINAASFRLPPGLWPPGRGRRHTC